MRTKSRHINTLVHKPRASLMGLIMMGVTAVVSRDIAKRTSDMVSKAATLGARM